jgi:glycosyltransferase involved in cell wall biosynthesis
MNKISGTIITLNNEKLITDCIMSLKKVCNEVIVLDSLSIDKTTEIAKELGARVYFQEFLGDGPQKKLASSYASNDWVFSLDADERLEDDLIEFVNSLELKTNNYKAFSFRRRNFCGKKWIKAASFYPDRVTRLYNKSLTNYTMSTSHAYVDSPAKSINCHLLHYTYSSYTDWINKVNFYSTTSAKTMHIAGIKRSSIRPVTHSLFSFFKKMFLKGGIFQGIDGFTVALTTMFNTYMKYIKLNELYDNNEDPSKHFPVKKSDKK